MSDSERIPSARMIRAARALLNLEQAELGELVGVDRRTIIRLEADEVQPVNPRRTKILAAIRDVLEKDKGIRFVYADKATGVGVIMKRGK
jgi:DNA-binding XRE family transcriptional regulator